MLLNNCSDGSRAVAAASQQRYRELRLHVLECQLPSELAHAGTARRLLMDLACERLRGIDAGEVTAILSTDADTIVAPDWVWRNLCAIREGADAVGGQIALSAEQMSGLPPAVLEAFRLDEQYQGLVARLESMLDPDANDPWPRHLQHFGASLAATPQIYRRAGGLPPRRVLEDAAFVQALREADARVRHCPHTRVFTSARMRGRAEVGFAWQLRQWNQHRGQQQHHRPRSETAAWLEHRFRSVHELKQMFAGQQRRRVESYPAHRQNRIRQCLESSTGTGEFLREIHADALIEESFRGVRWGFMHDAVTALRRRIRELEAGARAGRDDTDPFDRDRPVATPAVQAMHRAPGLR